MAKRSADKAELDNEQDEYVGVFKESDCKKYKITKTSFVQNNVIVYVVMIVGYNNRFLFTDAAKMREFLKIVRRSSKYPTMTMFSSKSDVAHVFDASSYDELKWPNYTPYMFEVMINQMGAVIKFHGDRDDFLAKMKTATRASLTALDLHYLAQLTNEVNEEND